jgi:hypothetical protein
VWPSKEYRQIETHGIGTPTINRDRQDEQETEATIKAERGTMKDRPPVFHSAFSVSRSSFFFILSIPVDYF